MSNPAIETRGLTVYYGKHRGIIDVDLTVEEGEVFGFLGPNGAGKTTTQRVLLDVFPPTRGHASIFGKDCQVQGVELRKRIGYLPGELALYTNMKVREFFQMVEYLRGENGTKGHWRELADRLELDTTRKIRQLSRGNKQKVGVVTAFMNRADLLILDEPTGGLDPLIQRIVLDMVREAKADGRTVFFSSHILSEVQAVCDRVGIIRDGRLVAVHGVEELFARRMNRINLIFDLLPPPEAFQMEGVTELDRGSQSILLEVRDNLPALLAKAARYDVRDIDTHNVSLEDIFLAYYSEENGGGHA